jgi:CPA2 family monovalent cation:H+ antiporter-2
VHPPTLLIEIGAVLLGLGLLGRMAGRWGVSPIPLYLLGGLAFGHGGLIPLSTSTDFLSIAAEIGVVLLLLVLGLEYSATELLTNLRTAVPAGILDALLNAVPGFALGLLLGWGPVLAIALAGVTWVSSSGVIAKVLSDLGRLGNRETPTILSVLVIEDLAMAFYLPILTAILAGRGLGGTALTLVIAVLALCLVLVVAVRYGNFVSALVSAQSAESLLLGVLGLTLLVAGTAEEVRVSAAVGAFLVGIAISGPVQERAATLVEPLRDLFAAIFFVLFGFRIDPGDLPPVLLPAIALAVVGIVTKVATGWWAARRQGLGVPARFRTGTALIARGEFSIVIAGLAIGTTVDADLVPLAAAYVLILAVAGPVITRYADPMTRAVNQPHAG